MIEHDYKTAKLLESRIRATGIGSIPDINADRVCELIMDIFPDIPFCPQLQRADVRESMFLQASENLPCLITDLKRNHIFYNDSIDREKELAEFFDYIAYNCYDYFKISPDYFRCFNLIIEKSRHLKNKFIKSQVIGPVTFLASVHNTNGWALLHDRDLSDAIICGLAMKGLWQASEIRKAGKTPIIFYDEPYLSSLGSAYIPLGSERVLSIINNLVEFIKERDDFLIGVHCCGNTDWEMMLKTKIDIISFDSYGFGKYFAINHESIKAFINRGGIIAFGAFPTSEYRDDITLDLVYDNLIETLETICKSGIDREVLLGSSIFTPSCGMGLLQKEVSDDILKLTRSLALRITESICL